MANVENRDLLLEKLSVKEYREIDVHVARILGWKNIRVDYGVPMGEPDDDYNRDHPSSPHRETIRFYSTEIDIAFHALTTAKHVKCWSLRWDDDCKKYKAKIVRASTCNEGLLDHFSEIAETAPLAICKAITSSFEELKMSNCLSDSMTEESHEIFGC